MRTTLLTLLLTVFSLWGFSQTVVFQEDFEGSSLGVTSSSVKNNNNWAVTSQLHFQGSKADSAKVGLADTTYLTTNAFSTTGNTFVTLEFAQICKIEFFDAAIIEVSNNNGQTWTKVTSGYLGNGQFSNIGNKFNATSYVNWLPANNNAVPDSTWWQYETFDISSYAANAAQVKIRFALIDVNSTGSAGNYGWLIDNIKVTAALSELQPPTITYSQPMLQDSVFNLGPFTIQASISDASGIDTAMLIYWRSGTTAWDTVGMNGAGSTYIGIIDTLPTAFSIGDTVRYFIYAKDASLSHNSTTNPMTGYVQFVIYTSPPPPSCTSPITSFPFMDNFDSNSNVSYPSCGGTYTVSGWSNVGPSNDWAPHSGTTTSYSTGPSGDHTSGNGIYLYTETSCSSGSYVAVLESPCLNLTNLSAPQLEFWYHMYGAAMGSLTVQVWYGGQYHDVWTKSGDQGNSWHKAIINLIPYKGITKIRFKGVRGTSYTSDMAIDDVKIWVPPANDAGITALNSPVTPAISGNLPVKVSMKNYGSANLSSATINWQINGVTQTAYNWTGTLPPMTTADSIQIGSYTFTAGAPSIKIWTSSPNGQSDGFPFNDTLNTSVVVCDGFLHGSYTVGTPSSDFATIADAVSALNNCGIDSSVVFNIAAGTYTGKIYLSSINGASDVNTITFKGQGDATKIQFATDATDRDVVRFQGTKHVIFDSLMIESTTSGTYACGIRFLNGSDSNIVRNCHIKVPVNTSSYTNGILFVGSNNSSYSQGTAAYNTLENNIVEGGYYSVSLRGASSYVKGNRVINNEMKSFRYYGIYSYYQDSVIIRNNYIHDNTYSYGYGLYTYRNKNGVRIEGNRVILHPQSGAYGIYLYYLNYQAGTADTCIVANNMVSLYNASSSVYGIYAYRAEKVKIFFNSLYSNSPATNGRLFYQSQGSGLYIENNIFVNTGSGYAYYVYTPTGIASSDYNDIYTTGSKFAYWSGDKSNLAALQSSSNKDANSVSADPQFVSISDLHAGAVAVHSAGIYKSEVPFDIDGDSRDTVPCIGADEFILVGDDAGITAMVSPVTSCPGDTSNIIVTVKNFGTDTLFSATVNWSVNGSLQSSASFTDTLLPGQYSNFPLGSFVFAANTSYDIVFWTTMPNGVADLNTGNDSLTVNNFKTALPAGTYTIGHSSSADYNSLDSVIADLNAHGICGPVVFSFDTGSYNGRLLLNNILGASPVNTLTFKSANGDSSSVIINYASSSSDPAIISLTDMSFVTVKGITFNITGSSAGRGIALWGNSKHNSFESCVFNLPQSTSSAFAGIYFNNSNVSYNSFINNAFYNGYYGAYVRGTSTLSPAHGNVLSGNIFDGFYYYGIYAYYQDSLIVNNNSLVNSSSSSYPRGMYLYYCSNYQEIIGNNISLSPSSYGYGIYRYRNTGTSANQQTIANNMISISSGSGSHYGIYNYYCYYNNYYYNSINISAGGSYSRGFYSSQGNNIKLKNNIISSVSFAYYISTTSAISASDYNDLYSTGTNLAYWNGNRANLTALKSASGMDAHSISADPSFISATNLHLISSPVDGMATPLASVTSDIDGEPRDTANPDMGADEFSPPAQDITVFNILAPTNGCGLTNVDVTVQARNTGTDTIQGNLTLKYSLDGGTTVVSENVSSVIPPTDTITYTFSTQANLSSSVDSTFNLMVWGALPQDPLSFNDTAYTSVFNGVVPPSPTLSGVQSAYGTTATLTASASGLILWYDSLNAVTPIGTGTSFTTPVLFDTTIYYCGALGTNGCMSNRVDDTVYVTGIPQGDVGISAIDVSTGCGLDSTEDVTITIYNQGIGTVSSGVSATFKINNNSWVTAENVTAPIGPGASIQYTFTAKANLFAPSDTMFDITAAVTLTGDPYHPNDTLKRDSVISLYTPPMPTATSPLSIAYGASATLTATSADSLLWFYQDTATIPFAGGSPVNVGPLYLTDTFYVGAISGASGTGTIGNGTNQNSTTSYPTPYGQYYTGTKEQYLILASELQAAGVPAGNIVSLAFDVVSPNSATSAGHNHDNYTIKMKNTTLSSLTSTFQTGLTQVYTVPQYQTVSGWNVHTFNTPFVWDGTSNLLIETCYDNYVNGSSWSNNAIVNRTSTNFTSTITYRSDQGNVCSHSTTNYTFQLRPNMQLVVKNVGCISQKAPVIVNVAPPPARDASAYSIENPIASVQSNIPTPVIIKLKNYGTQTLTSTTITYELDGTVKANYNWTGSVAFGDTSAPITVYTDTFSGGIHTMRFWVTGANGTTQTVNANDTISSTFSACMSGTFTIGDSTKDFQSFHEALAALDSAGICGNVTFLVDSGSYNEQLKILEIPGMDANNTVTFQGVTGDSTDVVLTYSPSASSNNYVLYLHGADYFRFKKMTIKSNGSTYGRSVVYDYNANNNLFEACVITTAGSNNYNSSAIYSMNSADSSNVFRGNHISKGYYTIYIRGNSQTSREYATVFENNIIENFYYYGVYGYYQDSLIIKNNIIKDGSSTYNYPRAIYLGYTGKAQEITGNTISLNPNVYAYGLYLYRNIFSQTEPGLFANNMISITGGTTSSHYGIYSYYTSYMKFYNNSVNIDGGGSNSRALYIYNGSGNDVINNILNVVGNGYAYYIQYSASISTSDYNNYMANNGFRAYWNGVRTTLSALQTANGQDSHSKNVDPDFFSSSDLHTNSIDLNNQGYPLAEVTMDIDGEARDSLHPDIGADEYTPPQWDAGVTAINAPTSPLTIGTNSVKVTVRNFGADTLVSATIGWTVNGTAQTSYSLTDTLPTGDTLMNINIGSFSAVAGANTIKVWTSMPNGHTDQVHFNDTSTVTLIGCSGPMSGVYTIGGATADYPDFSSAVNALNYCGINDTVEFVVNTGIYNEQISIGNISGASDTSIIIFRSATNDSTDVTLSYSASGSNNYTLRLNGADYVHFEHITIEATNSSAGHALVFNNGSNHNSFYGCIIKAPASTSSSTAALYSSGGKDDDNVFRYNAFKNGYYGIYFRGNGSSSSALESDNVFEYNQITGYYYYGVYFYYQDAVKLRNNFIQHGSSTSYGYAVYLYYCDNDMEISGNNIKLSPNSYNYGLRLYYCDGTATKQGRVFNNFISITSGSSSNYGFYVYNSHYQNISFNSVNITQGSNYSRCIYISSGGNINLMNNVFVNTAGGYAYYVSSTYAVSQSDHNDIYTNGSNFAYWSGNYSTLAALQAASGKDSNSVSVAPGFYAADDLHATSPLLGNGGTPFDSVMVDIDGQTRSTTAPSIGADEFTPLQWDVSAYAILQPSISYSAVTSTKTVEVNVRNFGMDTITSMNIGYIYAGGTPVVQSWTGVLLPGGNMNFTFNNQFTVQAGAQVLKVYTAFAQDMDNSNDTVSMVFTGMPLLSLSYFDNFDGPVNYWAQDGNVWQHGAPAQQNLNSAHSLPNAWMTKLSSDYPSNAEAYLYSPFINVANVTDATLKFWHKYKINSGDQANIQYSTDGGQTWALLGYMGDPAATNWYTNASGGMHFFSGTHTSWLLSTYNLHDILNPIGMPAPSTLQFRFKFYSNASGTDEGWLVDDFSVELPQIAFDGGVVGISDPDTSSIIGSTVTVTALVKNFGFDTLTSIPMRYTVNGGNPVQETWTVAGQGLLPGDTGSYTFSTTFTAPGSAYNLCAYTQIAGDSYSSNDNLCKNVQVAAAPLDAGVSLIVAPADTAPLFQPNTVVVRIKNYGTTPMSTVQLQYQINSQTPVVETWSGTALQMGDSVDYTFQTPYNSPVGSSYQLCAKTLLSGDMNPTNDQTCKSIIPDGIVEQLANGMKLWQNIPNPADGITTIRYEIPSGGSVHFEMVNATGKKIINTIEKKNAGVYNIDIDASKLANGIYFYSIEFDGQRLTKQMVVSR